MSYYETLYGEIVDEMKLINIIKQHINELNNTSFYDFGSGYGKITSTFHEYFRYCYGIELLKDRHTYALKNNSRANVYFYNKNFFDVHINSPCVMLLNNLCFGDGTNKRLSKKILEEVKEGSLIVASKQLHKLADHYKTYYTITCSWGESEIYVYKI
jgi:SAM-dependent methyltransferase